MTDEFAVNGNAAENNNNNIKFDPYTGEPINRNAAETGASTENAGAQAGTATGAQTGARTENAFSTPRAQGSVGGGAQQSYHAPSYNGGEAPRGGEYSFRPTEARFDPHEGMHGASQGAPNGAPYGAPHGNVPPRDAFSGAAFTGAPVGQPAANPNGKKEKKHGERRGLGKGAVALIVAACIVVSGAAGFGGAMLAGAYSSGGSTVIYKTADGTGTTSTSSSDDSASGIPAVAAKVENSVVEIVTEQVTTNSFFGQYVTQGAGSGVIISEDGNIITCAHVIDGASTITVKTADGTSYTAKLIGSDSQTDIAVIKIDASGLQPAVIGDSSSLVVGEQAIAVGNPLGELGGTVTSGIISALERQVNIDGTTYTLLQTSAAINPGNSGGALFNGSGELIGIVNAKESGSSIEGLGFAIPINSAMTVAEDLLTNGYVSGRPQLGVVLAEVNSNTSLSNIRNSEYSSLINYITDYGVYFIKYADGVTGDLQFGDRIVALDNVSVSSRSDIKSLLAEHEIGDTVTLTVSRIEDTRIGRATMTEVQITLTEAQANS